MEELYSNEESSMILQPKRVVTHIDNESVILTMPSFSTRLGLFAVKIVSEYKKNPEKNSLPVQGGLTVLMSSRSSSILALLDSPTITSIRTGAVSGLATKYLSRSASQEVGSIGSGQQARAMLEAACVVRKIKHAKVFSRDSRNSNLFAVEMSDKLDITVEAVRDRKSASEGVDILNVATNSSIPVLSWDEIPKNIHINSVGTLPERRELDLDTIVNSELYVDTKVGVLSDAGDVIHAVHSGKLKESTIKGDLFELVTGTRQAKTDLSGTTLFKSVGFALQDVYACNRVFHNVSRSNNS
jgi:ornithine cyclodeaminase